MRFARTFSLAAGLVLLSALPAAAQDIDGTWVFSVNSPDGLVQMEVDFEQDGAEVMGAVRLDMADSAEITDGKLEDDMLSFWLHVGVQGELFSVEVSATVDGDEMTGEAFLAEMGTMSLTAKKASG